MQIWLRTNIRSHNSIDDLYWHEQYDEARKIIDPESTLVYDSGEKVVGSISVFQDSLIYGIYVARKYQQKGIATKLIDIFKEKYPCLSVNIFKENERAVKYFLNRGFTISKETRNEKAGGIEVTLEWSIKSKASCPTQ